MRHTLLAACLLTATIGLTVLPGAAGIPDHACSGSVNNPFTGEPFCVGREDGCIQYWDERNGKEGGQRADTALTAHCPRDPPAAN